MLHRVYSIYDIKSETYSPPFLQKNDIEAKRSFQEIANDKNTMVSKYPEDFTLCSIGTFNDALGMLQATEARTIDSASQYSRQSAPQEVAHHQV